MNANSQNRLDTSDDNASNNALIPMGIQEYPVTPTEKASKRNKASIKDNIECQIEENDAMGTMLAGSDEKSTTRKH